MKKAFISLVDKVVSFTVKTNVNSTTSVAAYQPKLPKEAKNYKK